MAIFFNGELQSAPVIREAIPSGRAQISGGDNGFVYEEAKTMVDLLNAGALPIPAKSLTFTTSALLWKARTHQSGETDKT